MIKALEKAESLAKLQRHEGSPITDFVVVLTPKEAFELIDWYLTQELELDIVRLASDVALARSQRDPMIVLQHFTLSGFPIMLSTRQH